MDAQVTRTRNVNQDAARAFYAAFFQQRRTNRLPRRLHRRILAFGRSRAHHGVAHAAHNGANVGEIAIDQARRRHDVANALHALAQHVIGNPERVKKAGAFRH